MSTRVILWVQSEAETAFLCGATEFASSFQCGSCLLNLQFSAAKSLIHSVMFFLLLDVF